MARIAVVGAGIAGLGAAHALQKAGHQVIVLESSDAVGGRMQTRSEQGFTWDAGAQFMLQEYTHMKRLMAELNLPLSEHPIDPVQAILLPDRRRFYCRVDSPLTVFKHPALSLGAKLRMAKVMLSAARHRERLDFHHPERAAAIDTESLRAWGDREIGRDAVDYFLSLTTSTLFFWRPEETPWWMAPAFALLSSRWHVMLPQGGMGAVPEALARRLDVRLHTAVRGIDLTPDGSVCLRLSTPEGRPADLTADRVVLATPAPIALKLLQDPEGALGRIRAAYLRSIRYVRNATTAVAYSKAPERRAYGVGIPTALNQSLAAIGWEHLKGPDRAPAGAGLAVLMPTGAFTDQVWAGADEAIGAALIDAAGAVYPESQRAALFHRVHRWEHAIPLQEPGRTRRMAEAWAAGPAAGSPVFTCGDYWFGASTEMALVSGWRAAAEVLQSIKAPVPAELAV
jgi:oxygen-dependent protoporphyrinogen oxidase